MLVVLPAVVGPARDARFNFGIATLEPDAWLLLDKASERGAAEEGALLEAVVGEAALFDVDDDRAWSRDDTVEAVNEAEIGADGCPGGTGGAYEGGGGGGDDAKLVPAGPAETARGAGTTSKCSLRSRRAERRRGETIR